MKRYKYPKTFHAPWSKGITNDDKIHKNMSFFEDKEVVITEKMDGQNCTIYGDGYVHARSIDSKNHPSRNWVKGYAQKICYGLGNYRVCGENLYAKHSIAYKGLDSYFLAFSIWEYEVCLHWDETLDICDMLEIYVPKVLFRGMYDEEEIKKIEIENGTEGYVIRTVEGFTLDTFPNHVAKVVRENHIQTDSEWKNSEIEKNCLSALPWYSMSNKLKETIVNENQERGFKNITGGKKCIK